MTRSKSHLSAIILMLKASASFSVMTVCVKFASHSLPSMEIVFFRSVMGTVMIVALMLQKKISIFGKERGLLTLRGLCGFLALSLHFYTIAHLTLGTAVMLNYTHPIFATIFSMLFLGERPTLSLLAMIGLSFWGVVMLVGGRLEHWNTMVLLGILSAIFAAAAYVSIRALRRRESPLTVIFYFTAISAVASAFFLPREFQWPDLAGWLTLIGVGIGSFYGQLWMTIGFRRAPASLISPFFYLTPMLGFFYGWIFFGEKLSPQSLAGAGLIILAGSLISVFETRIKKSGKS